MQLQELESEKERMEEERIAALAAEAAAQQKAEQEKADFAARNIEVALPSMFMGFIIGRKGANITEIMAKTGTTVSVNSEKCECICMCFHARTLS